MAIHPDVLEQIHPDMLEQARRFHQAGQLAEAERVPLPEMIAAFAG